MACVYILYSKYWKKFYVGSSRNDEARARLSSHNAGKTRSTKGGREWVLINEEKCLNYTQARKRENFLKSGAGRKWIRENFSV